MKELNFQDIFFHDISEWENSNGNWVVHYDHYTRKIIGFAHDVCNKKLRQSIKYYATCAYANNSQKFDLKFLVSAIIFLNGVPLM